MGSRMRKTIVAVLAIVAAVALSGLVLGCSSSSGATSSAASSSSTAVNASSPSTAQSSSSAAPEEPKSVTAADDSPDGSSDAVKGEAFVGTWDYEYPEGKITFELTADGKGRILFYEAGSSLPYLKDSCSWRASSETTGSIWIGGSHPIKLIQNGKAFELNLRDLEDMGTFHSGTTTGIFYKR